MKENEMSDKPRVAQIECECAKPEVIFGHCNYCGKPLAAAPRVAASSPSEPTGLPKFPSGEPMPIHWCTGQEWTPGRFRYYPKEVCSVCMGENAIQYTPAAPAVPPEPTPVGALAQQCAAAVCRGLPGLDQPRVSRVIQDVLDARPASPIANPGKMMPANPEVLEGLKRDVLAELDKQKLWVGPTVSGYEPQSLRRRVAALFNAARPGNAVVKEKP